MLFKNFFRSNKSVQAFEDLLNGDRNKVLARNIVLKDIKPFYGDGIAYDSDKHVHVIIVGSDTLSLCIARQAALVCHYPNFKESGGNRTIITIVDIKSKGREDVENLKRGFESITGNLLSESIWKCISCEDEQVEWDCGKKDSFVDLEFEFVGLHAKEVEEYINDVAIGNMNAILSIIDNTDLELKNTKTNNLIYQYYKLNYMQLCESDLDFKIDVSNAQKINMIYQCGTDLENINNINTYDSDAYNSALNTFCSHLKKERYVEEWNKIDDQTIKLSNVFCADCIDVKIRCLETKKHKIGKPKISSADLSNLAKSEHNRWNVEKLILGYRPLNDAERMEDNRLLKTDKDQLKAYRKYLKKDKHAHIDICSCAELKRIDFDNYKYDCLLTLAIREI